MQCPKCNYLLSDFDTECPRCAKMPTPGESPQSISPPPTAGASSQDTPQVAVATPAPTSKNAVAGCIVLFIFGFILLSVVFNSAGRSGFNPLSANVVTMSEYNQIEYGMSYAQVVEIIGDPGEELSSNQMPGIRGYTPSITTVMYMWKNGGGANMNAMFQNDKLVQKAQFGLR